MSRIEPGSRKAASAETDENSEQPARDAREKPDRPAPPEIRHSAGSRDLARRSSPAAVFAASVLVSEKRPPSAQRQPQPIDGYPGAKEVERLLIGNDTPPLPPQPHVTRPNARPGSESRRSEAGNGPRPPRHVELFEAYRKASVQFEKLSRGLAAAEKAWSAIAAHRQARLQADPARGNGEGLEQTVVYAERQIALCREQLRDLQEKFGAATTQWELLTGRRKGAAVGPATHTGAGRAKSELEALRERLDRYDNSVNLMKSSPLGSIVTAAYMAAATLNGRKLDDRDFAILDDINTAGKLLSAVPSLHPRSGPVGAASPAPGVDRRWSATLPTQSANPTEVRPRVE